MQFNPAVVGIGIIVGAGIFALGIVAIMTRLGFFKNDKGYSYWKKRHDQDIAERKSRTTTKRK